MKRHTKLYVATGFLLLAVGLLLGSWQLANGFQRKNAAPAFSSVHSQTPAKKPTVSGAPTHIDIPSVDVSADIEPGYYDKATQTWTLSTTKAEYATVTPEPNNGGGNTFIYGHNRWAVFYKLLKVKPGDEAIITTANNHTFTYKMTAQRVTNPNDTSLFTYHGAPILTLQTCSGLWYQNRSLFIFNLEKVS